MSAGGDPQQVVRLAAEAGFDGVALGPDCTRGYVVPLGAAALSAGLAFPVMAAPTADGPLGAGRRLPYLAALDDEDERRAAVTLFASTLELGVPLGIRQFTVDLGAVALTTSAREVARRFARRELLDEDEPGARQWAAALGERRALSGLVVDACRYALDRIVPQAERRDALISLEMAGDPWSAPSPREALALLAEYRGGPLGLVWDEARLQVLTTLGVAPAPERAALLAAGATVWRANDAVGIRTGFLPGLGDPPAAPGTSHPAAGTPVIVIGRPDSTAEEVAAARLKVAAGMARAAVSGDPSLPYGPFPAG